MATDDKGKSKTKSTGIIPGQFQGRSRAELEKLHRKSAKDPQNPYFPDIWSEHSIAGKDQKEVPPAQDVEETTQNARDKSAGKAIQIAGGKSWDEIKVTFLSERSVQIYVAGTNRGVFNYSELGFEDQKTRNPILAWKMLDEISGKNGTWPRPRPGQPRAQQQKRIEEMRKKMRGIFLIKGDPVPFNGSMYQTRFKICRNPSYDA